MEVEMTDAMMVSLGKVGAIGSLCFAAIGSALGTGAAGAAAIGAWKKCYGQNKAAPFLLLAFVGAPLSQTIYGMILMLFINGRAVQVLKAAELGADEVPAMFPALLAGGVFAGLAIGFSAWLQGKAGAGGCHALAETGQGFTNYLAVVGVIETVAIFVMAFAMIVL
jgi:V/A-type H+/Na+-transporting ATPase subunit K